jgi:hypothetical protein
LAPTRRRECEGAAATADDVAQFTVLVGRAPRSYRAFAKDAATPWANH